MLDFTSTEYNHEIFSNQCKNALDIAPDTISEVIRGD